MACSIQDGTGDGYSARVDIDNRLAVSAITAPIQALGASQGNGYNLATSRITLTNTDESALFYIKNNEANPLLLSTAFFNTSASSGTLVGQQPTLKIYRNPRSGTIISNASPAMQSNNNFGSNQTLVADIYEGFEGATLADQTNVIDVPLPTRAAVTFSEFPTTVILPRGASYGISYQPEVGSTSVDLIVGVTLVVLPSEFS